MSKAAVHQCLLKSCLEGWGGEDAVNTSDLLASRVSLSNGDGCSRLSELKVMKHMGSI